MTLGRRLDRLEALASPTPRVWIEGLDDDVLVCEQTGERVPVEDAGRLGAGDIVVRYVRDWRDHAPGA